jgi:hypothetical protein
MDAFANTYVHFDASIQFESYSGHAVGPWFATAGDGYMHNREIMTMFI